MSSETEGREAAAEFRRIHGLGLGPLEDMVELVASTVGIDVMILVAGETEHGLTMADPTRHVVVMAVATTPFSARQRSSIAHELAHYLWKDEDLAFRDAFGESSDSESRANAFARHLLLPLESARGPALAGDDNIAAEVSRLVERFDVSPHIAAIQLKEAGRISIAECAEYARVSARQLATRYGWLDLYDQRSKAANHPRSPQFLLARATSGYVAGVVSLVEVADWAGKAPEAIAQDFQTAGIRPAERDDWEDTPDDPLKSE